jgi:hypothetical protein
MQKLKQLLNELLQKIKDHPASWPFLEPVDVDVPNYYNTIKDPIGKEILFLFCFILFVIVFLLFFFFCLFSNLSFYFKTIDLKTIEARAARGNYYITKEIFYSDVQRMCDNCKKFNSEGSEYYQCAVDIENLMKRAQQAPRKSTLKTAEKQNSSEVVEK